MTDNTEVRYCPLGPPHEVRRPGSRSRVGYAWCSLCEHVRKSTDHCPMVDEADRAEADRRAAADKRRHEGDE